MIWIYQDEDGVHEISDKDILSKYYPWWEANMKRLGRHLLISEANCIEDFVTVHWAYPKPPDSQTNKE